MSGYLVDTNVISEILKTVPDAQVAAWSDAANKEALYLSVISVGELRKGVELLAPSARRSQLERAIEERVPSWFGTRVLPLSEPVAERWGALSARRQLAGRPLAVTDGQIAATALEHDLVIVTRNVRHFEGLGVSIVNPWETAL